MINLTIEGLYITLQQALKMANIISSGGMAKAFLHEEEVYVNQEREVRRGRKLYPGDLISWNGQDIKIV